MVLTHSASQVLISDHSIACNQPVTGLHSDNSYWRSFTPSDPPFDRVGSIVVDRIEFGIQSAVSPNGAQPVVLRIYDDPTPPLLAPVSDLILRHEQAFSVPKTTLSLFCAELSKEIEIGPGETFVVEIFLPDGVSEGNAFIIGSNPGGETSSSFFSAVDCGVLEPTPLEILGVPDVHVVINVYFYQASPNFIRGDFDGDAEFNPLTDALYGLNFGFLAGPPPACLEAADANDDGIFSPLADSLHTLNYGFLGGPPPPLPFPDCGPDPEPQTSLDCLANGCL